MGGQSNVAIFIQNTRQTSRHEPIRHIDPCDRRPSGDGPWFCPGGPAECVVSRLDLHRTERHVGMMRSLTRFHGNRRGGQTSADETSSWENQERERGEMKSDLGRKPLFCN